MPTTKPKKKIKPITAVDLFCGAGGMSSGILEAFSHLQIPCALTAINHWPIAVDTHALNHPKVKHICEDISNVNPRKLFEEGGVQVLTGGPSCFVAGTLILTTRGLVPIEDIKVGDKVLTHKGRWKKVTHVFGKRLAKTCVLSGHGHQGLETTPEHPFYSKRYEKKYPGKGPDGKRPSTQIRLTGEFWPTAKTLGQKKYRWATPSYVPPLPIPSPDYPGIQWDENFFFFLGVYIGDGYTNTNGKEIHISEGYHQSEETLRILSEERPIKDRTGKPLNWYPEKSKTAARLSTCHSALNRWLNKNCNRGCENKELPAWMFGIPNNWKQAFLEGYRHSDGCKNKHRSSISSCQKKLAIGCKILLASLKFPGTYYSATNPESEIKGRKIKGGLLHTTSWTTDLQNKTFWEDDIHIFTRIRNYQETNKFKEVYNFEVEDDNSYVADGIIVHNCVSHSAARGGRPLDCDQDRATPWCMVRWAESTLPEVIVIENVPQFRAWGPLLRKRCKVTVRVPRPAFKKWSTAQKKKNLPHTREDWKANTEITKKTVTKIQWVPDKSKEGETFHAWINCFEALGYRVDHKVLCTANYGDPTIRKRLFIMATRGKRKPVWPNPTHNEEPEKTLDDLFARNLRPWIPTFDIVDWTLIGKSVFNRKNPLVDKTMRRVWVGFQRYTLPKLVENERRQNMTGYVIPKYEGNLGEAIVETNQLLKEEEPFLIKYKGTGTAETIREPITTIQSSGNHHGLAQVEITDNYVVRYHGMSTAENIHKPMSSVEAKGQTHYLAQSESKRHEIATKLGEDPEQKYNQNSEIREIKPLHGEPFLVQISHGNDRPSDNNRRVRGTGDTMPGLTGSTEWAVSEPEITKAEGFLLHTNHGENIGEKGDSRVKPMNSTFPTVCGNRGEVALALPELGIASYVTTIDNQGKKGVHPTGGVQGIYDSLSTITSKARHALLTPEAQSVRTTKPLSEKPRSQPTKEVTYYRTGPKNKQNGNTQLIEFDPATEGLPKTGKFYVQVINSLYEIDIKLRMFEPHELSLAQGFPRSYQFKGNKTQQVKQIGNAVPRRTVRALVLAAWTQNPDIPYLEDDDLFPTHKSKK